MTTASIIHSVHTEHPVRTAHGTGRVRPARWWSCVTALLCCAWLGTSTAATTPPTVFAAASLKPALDEIAASGQLGRPAPRVVYAASSALARQIEAGAPADIFVSADRRWMDDAASHHAIVPATRTSLLTNSLVLIGTPGITANIDLDRGAQPILALLGTDGRMAIALPRSVPAGIYAHEALRTLGLWSALEPRLAMASDVRAVLNMVLLGQCALGIVYRSDATSTQRVKVLATFPASSHSPIIYAAAIVSGHDDERSRAMLSALQSNRARAIFQRWGFTPLGH